MVINHWRNTKLDCTRPQSRMIPFNSFLRVGSNRTSIQRNGIKILTIGNPQINPRFPRTLELEYQFKLERESLLWCSWPRENRSNFSSEWGGFILARIEGVHSLNFRCGIESLKTKFGKQENTRTDAVRMRFGTKAHQGWGVAGGGVGRLLLAQPVSKAAQPVGRAA